jgi:hypothetical protein
VIYAYLVCSIIAIQKQFVGIASLIREMSRNWISKIDCLKAFLCSGNNDVSHISEEVRNGLDGQIKSKRLSVKKIFPSKICY